MRYTRRSHTDAACFLACVHNHLIYLIAGKLICPRVRGERIIPLSATTNDIRRCRIGSPLICISGESITKTIDAITKKS